MEKEFCRELNELAGAIRVFKDNVSAIEHIVYGLRKKISRKSLSNDALPYLDTARAGLLLAFSELSDAAVALENAAECE